MLTYEAIKTKYDLYLARLDQELEKNPNNVEALIHKAILFFEFYQKIDEAEVMLQAILDKNPKNAEVYFWFSVFKYSIYSDYPEAAAFLGRALEIAPERADCHSFLASMLEEFANIDPAVVEYHYKKSFELEPSFINSRFYLAKYLFKLGRLQDARHEFKAMLSHCTERGWPTKNPVEECYEDMITGRSRTDVKQFALEYLQKIDAAEAAAKMEPGKA